MAFNNTCLVGGCPTGYYYISSNNTCYICNTNCLVCSGFPSPCSVCSTGFFYFSNDCITTCPNSYFMNTLSNTCDACNSSCSICVNLANNCSKCNSGYYLYAS